MSRETVFLTGFPGFIAGRLLRRLAAEDLRFLLLVQPALMTQAEAEIRAIAEHAGKPASDFVVLPGDITLPELGLSDTDLERARNETNLVFHLAAFYDLAVDREPAMRVNVDGTRNVNEFVRTVRDLGQYHYISTCYVAGKRRGRILESELRHDAGFRNHYEESKHLAEIEVENLKRELPVTIHRPSVVCGDSQTGETAKRDGIYYLIDYILRWPSGLSRFNLGNQDVSLNLVPVDFVVEALAVLRRDQRAVGATLQIADPNPLSTFELFNTIATTITGRPGSWRLPPRLVEFTLMFPGAPLITHLPHSAVPYFFLKQTYDTAVSQPLLAAHGVHCPHFTSYVEKIVRG